MADKQNNSKKIPFKLSFSHDRFTKAAFSDLELAKELLQDFLPHSISRHLNWDSLKIENPNLVTRELSESQADLLFRIKLSQQDISIYIVFEHKSFQDSRTVIQAISYAAKLYEMQLTKKKKLSKIEPVICLVLYHGQGNWRLPSSLLEGLNLEEELKKDLRGYMLDFNCYVEDLGRRDVEKTKSKKLRAVLFALKHVWKFKEKKIRERFFSMTKGLTKWKRGVELLEILMEYFIKWAEIDQRELEELSENNLEPEAQKKMKTTAQKIWEEGREDGIQEIAKKMYEKGTSIEKIIELTDLSSEELKELLLNHHKK